MGTLLPALSSKGGDSGRPTFDGNTTFGTLDLGGASTQIAFFIPSQVCLLISCCIIYDDDDQVILFYTHIYVHLI
jgi:hypothetical protein